MRAHFEKVTSIGASFRSFERVLPEFPFEWHYHPEFELTLIVDSYGQRFVGDGIGEYGPGDLVLIGPNLPHTWRSDSSRPGSPELHRAIVVQFRERCFGRDFFSLEEMESLRLLLKNSMCGLGFAKAERGREVADKLRGITALSPARRMVKLLSVLLDLAEIAQPQTLSSGQIAPVCRIDHQERINTICVHLNEHFEEEIDYAAISRKVHMDRTSLCHFFKRSTRRTMTAYVNELRVAAAARLLSGTDASVLDIGFKVGFGNYSNFNRQFKRIQGVNPSEVRRMALSRRQQPGRNQEGKANL